MDTGHVVCTLLSCIVMYIVCSCIKVLYVLGAATTARVYVHHGSSPWSQLAMYAFICEGLICPL